MKNEFILMKNIATKDDVFDNWVVKYHSSVLCQTPIQWYAYEFAQRCRNDRDRLREEVAKKIMENAEMAANLINRTGVPAAGRQFLAENMMLVDWLVADETPADWTIEEAAQ